MTHSTSLITKVDLREQFSNIRDQHSRPLCLAFASSDLNAYVNGLKHALSVEYLSYYAYNDFSNNKFDSGLTIQAVSSVLFNRGQPEESELPYQISNQEPSEPPHCDFEEKIYSSGQEKALTPDEIVQNLNSGVPVIVGVELSHTFFNPKPPYLINYEDGNFGGHALIIIGYGKCDKGENYFLIRNSWGPQWADAGYAWLSADYISRKSITFMELNKKCT